MSCCAGTSVTVLGKWNRRSSSAEQLPTGSPGGMGKPRHGQRWPSGAEGMDPALPPCRGYALGRCRKEKLSWPQLDLMALGVLGFTVAVGLGGGRSACPHNRNPGPVRGVRPRQLWVPGQHQGRSPSPWPPALSRPRSGGGFPSRQAMGWPGPWCPCALNAVDPGSASLCRGTAPAPCAWGGGTTRVRCGTGWAALMSGPWHPPCSGCPAAAHAWDSCSLPAQWPHRTLPHVPHGTGHPAAPGIAWHQAQGDVQRRRCGVSTRTRVAPGAATHVGTGACQALPAVPWQVPLRLVTLPQRGAASRRRRDCSGWGRAVLVPRCPPCCCLQPPAQPSTVPVSGGCGTGGSARGTLPPAPANRANWHPG